MYIQLKFINKDALFNYFDFFLFFQLNKWQLHCKTFNLGRMIKSAEPLLLKGTSKTPPIHMGYADP